MKLRSPFMYSAAFLALAATYTTWFNVVVRTDADAAYSRFEALQSSGAARRAAPYGERVLSMRREAGADEEALAPFKSTVGAVEIAAHRYERGAALIQEALSSDWARTLPAQERAAMEDHLARAFILAGDIDRAVSIHFDFLELAGDEASRAEYEDAESLEAYYASRVLSAADLFAESLKIKGGGEQFEGPKEVRLASANQMVALGAFYSMREEGLYAAASLLSAAYEIRRDLLGAENQATVQAALLLGPVFAEIGRLADAESLYLEAFHAQEKVKGANSPDLSLYIKLLAGIYERQGRATEAQALNEHMRALFRDAFGAQRYAANRAHDRRSDTNRPVSQYFLLPADFAPTDLVAASDYSIPLSKTNGLDEMKLRLAPDEGDDPRENNLPARLAQLISLCASESGDRLTLRSGYRSYATQKELYSRIGFKGTVTPPGMSEHQTGLAADVDVNGRFMRRGDAAYHCFEENAFQFGFILSYPPGNNYLPGADSFEPWHWRYVGIQTAQLYREAGPIDKPQEFLAALPCYEQRAEAGLFPNAGEADLCLSEPEVVTASTEAGSEPPASPVLPAITRNSARKLNNGPESARTR